MDVLIEAAQNIGFDWKMALASLVNFLIIFFLLKKFVWSSMKEVMDKRSALIEKGLDDAKDAEGLQEKAKEDYSESMKKAEEEAFSIITDARHKGEGIVTKATDKATEQSDEIVNAAKGVIDAERKEMEKALRLQTANVVISGVEKVLKEKLDKEKDSEIINKALKR